MSPSIKAAASALMADKRLLPAYGICVVLVSLLIWRAGYNYHSATLGEIASMAEQYSALKSVMDKAGEIKARKEEYEKKVKVLESGLIGEDKPSIGAARLQEAFKALASRHGITLVSQKSLPSAALADRYVRVAVEFQVKAELPQIKELLYDIHISPVLMGVRYVRVKAPTDAGFNRNLDVTMVVEGAIMKRSGV